MFDFWPRATQTVDDETRKLVDCEGVAEGSRTEPDADVEHRAVEEAVRIIEKHVDKEARNRWVEHLEVRDLCPRQKADLVAELANIFQ